MQNAGIVHAENEEEDDVPEMNSSFTGKDQMMFSLGGLREGGLGEAFVKSYKKVSILRRNLEGSIRTILSQKLPSLSTRWPKEAHRPVLLFSTLCNVSMQAWLT